MKTDLDTLSQQIREHFTHNGFSDENSDVLFALLIEQSLQLIYTTIQLSLDSIDVRAIDTICIENDFDEDQKAMMYKEYFEDKTKIDTYELLCETIEDLFNVIKAEETFVSRFGKMMAEKVEKAEFEEIEAYLDHISEKTDRDLNVKLSKMLGNANG